nr:MAG TPA: glycoside hydrolase family protein [Bacteriophage sp.]
MYPPPPLWWPPPPDRFALSVSTQTAIKLRLQCARG